MPCIPIRDGFLCVGNDPVSVEYPGRTYRFEWTAAAGWMPVNLDGSQRLSPVPKGAWMLLLKEHPREGGPVA